MDRRVRVNVTGLVGVLSIVTGLLLQAWVVDISKWFQQFSPMAEWMTLVRISGETGELVGLVLIGVATHAWVTGPRD